MLTSILTVLAVVALFLFPVTTLATLAGLLLAASTPLTLWPSIGIALALALITNN